MLTFLRRIRKRLIEGGATSKYLLYAFGEITLVVIGILIALTINNWNEDRLNRKEEKVILQNLKEEFTFNREELKSTEILLNNAQIAATTLLHLFGEEGRNTSEDFVDSLIYSTLWAPTFNPSQSVLNDITYSGKMNFIVDENLRQRLFTWDSKIEDFKEQEINMYNNLNRHVIPRLETIISFRNIEKFGPLKFVGDSKLGRSNVSMLQNAEAENIYDNHLYELTNVHDFYPGLYDIIDEILVLVY